MLVYGDWSETVDPEKLLADLSHQLRAIALMEGGIDRHAKLVGVLIAAGQLLQGFADAGWPVRDISKFVHALARSVVHSFDSGFAGLGELARVPTAPFPGRVHVRLPEGFAFYGVYPEGYIEAARRLKLVGSPRVIGIRSIGATLGAVVSVAIGAPNAVTVRPTGDPFSREVELPSGIIEPGLHYVIVDEGPGLSGSSFGAVADQLEAHGVPLERIAFLPSHRGELGPQASDKHRIRWNRAQRVPGEFEPSFLEQRFGVLEKFVGGGTWQRTKFIGTCDGSPVLLKFAGLGAIGERKLQIGRALHSAGFTPEPLSLMHGFIAERWCDDARPLGDAEKPVQEIGRYIGARARLFQAPALTGAGVAELLAMARRNIGLALGEAAACRLDQFQELGKATLVRRVRSDNKMQPEEWLRLPNGRLLKMDALDHHQAHDLIGCQAAEWDLAGAIEEFELDAGEATRLVEAAMLDPDLELLGFYRVAYAAFRLGQCDLAADHRGVQRYARSVEHLLHQNS